MELLQLQYFQVLARVQHVTKAAEELSIAQPSLSKTIRRLEKEIGIPLFERKGRTIRLNQFGKAFLKRVDTIFHELEEGQRQVRDMAGLENNEISLIAASLHWLPDPIAGFQLHHPSVRFRLTQCSPHEMQRKLENSDGDFCFLSTPLHKSGIKWKTLLVEELLLVVPPHHRLATYEEISLQEIANEPIVFEKTGGDIRNLIDALYQQAGFSPNIVCEMDEPATIMQFVKASLGITIVPAYARAQIHELKLHSIHLTNPNAQRTFGMAWYQEHYLSEAARAFQKFIIEYFVNMKK